MACQIAYKDKEVLTNNRQFAGLIDFVVEVGAQSTKSSEETQFVERMKYLRDHEFWPGRGIQIEDDFPNVDEQKFWARVFLDTARALFDRRIGEHEHSFWQAQRIHQAYAAGQLFVEAVRGADRRWLPDSIDYREFDAVVNKIKPT